MWLTVLTVAELVYVFGLSIWILLEKRPAVSTVAWILSLFALPYVGFVIFFFFGPRRLERRRLRHTRARGHVRKITQAAAQSVRGSTLADSRAQAIAKLASVAGETVALPCATIRIHHDAASTYDAIARAVREAKHHVHVSYYIFEDGDAAAPLLELLAARAREGVEVRLLVDAVGSSGLGRKSVRRLRDAGVRFSWFRSVSFARLRKRIDFRNHRKIVVCDGVVGFTGGINVCDDYLDRDALPAWRDTHLELRGDAVRGLQLTFLDDWYFATGYVPKDKAYFPPPDGLGDHVVHVLASGPDHAWESIALAYFTAMTHAEERVWVTTPYFVPDEAMLAALKTAAMRGVDVRVLLPRRSDSRIVTAAARSYYDEILAAGVRVFEYLPTMIHAKTLVVDDVLGVVGTANLDNRSFRLNFETSVLLYGEAQAAELARAFERDLAGAKEVKLAERRPTLAERFGEAGARVFSPLL